MCLNVVKDTEAKVATRNKRVFKVLVGSKKNGYGSPYVGAAYFLGQEKRINDFAWEATKRNAKNGMSIKDGALHSYLRFQDARDNWHKAQIYEAIIPKGAEYIVGLNNEVVSNALVVKRRHLPKKGL